MSAGWSPTGTFVMPGRSMITKSGTRAEWMVRQMGSGEMPLLRPAPRSISFMISAFTSSKLYHRCPGLCWNSTLSASSAAGAEASDSPSAGWRARGDT